MSIRNRENRKKNKRKREERRKNFITQAEKAERGIPLPPEAAEALSEQRELFRKKFGREPGPNDPVFFDPDADEPRPIDPKKMDEGLVRAASKAGLPAEKIKWLEKHVSRDMLFKCPGCGAETLAWSMAVLAGGPKCPRCGGQMKSTNLSVKGRDSASEPAEKLCKREWELISMINRAWMPGKRASDAKQARASAGMLLTAKLLLLTEAPHVNFEDPVVVDPFEKSSDELAASMIAHIGGEYPEDLARTRPPAFRWSTELRDDDLIDEKILHLIPGAEDLFDVANELLVKLHEERGAAVDLKGEISSQIVAAMALAKFSIAAYGNGKVAGVLEDLADVAAKQWGPGAPG